MSFRQVIVDKLITQEKVKYWQSNANKLMKN